MFLCAFLNYSESKSILPVEFYKLYFVSKIIYISIHTDLQGTDNHNFTTQTFKNHYKKGLYFTQIKKPES